MTNPRKAGEVPVSMTLKYYGEVREHTIEASSPEFGRHMELFASGPYFTPRRERWISGLFENYHLHHTGSLSDDDMEHFCCLGYWVHGVCGRSDSSEEDGLCDGPDGPTAHLSHESTEELGLMSHSGDIQLRMPYPPHPGRAKDDIWVRAAAGRFELSGTAGDLVSLNDSLDLTDISAGGGGDSGYPIWGLLGFSPWTVIAMVLAIAPPLFFNPPGQANNDTNQ